MKKSFMFFAIACLMLLFAMPVLAREPLADFLVKKGIATDEEIAAWEAESKPSSMRSRSQELMLGGYVQALYTQKDDAVDFDETFSIKSTYMWLKGYVAPDWCIFISWYIHDPKMFDAQITYEYNPMLRISAGMFLLPYSTDLLTSPSLVDTIYYDLASLRIADHRDIGVMAEGAMMEGKVGYGLAFVNGNGINNNGDNNDKKDIVARIWAKPFLGSEGSPLAGLMVAAATQFGEQPMTGQVVDPATGAITQVDLGDESRTRWIGSAQWKFNQIKVQGEYMYQDLEDSDVTSDGYYVVATYDVPIQRMILQPVVKYETFDPNDDIDDDETNITTLGANVFFANKKARIALNYRMIDEEPEVDNNEFLAMMQLLF